jgi:hypothetical protein
MPLARSQSVVFLLDRMAADHHRLDLLLGAAVDSAERENWAGAARPLDAFVTGLSAEMRAEERLLFPAYLAKGGIAGLVASLHDEHVVLAGAARQMQRAVAEGNLGAFRDAHDGLMNVLTYHELKEERGVCAELDRWLSPDERERLVGELDGALAVSTDHEI